METVKEILPPSDKDICIHDNFSPEALINLIEKDKSEKHLIIIQPDFDYDIVVEKLNSIGFVENKDYVNVLSLFPREQGGYA